MSAKCRLSVPVFHFRPKLTYPAASADSLRYLRYLFCLYCYCFDLIWFVLLIVVYHVCLVNKGSHMHMYSHVLCSAVHCVVRYWRRCSTYMQNHEISFTAIWNQRTFFYLLATHFHRCAFQYQSINQSSYLANYARQHELNNKKAQWRATREACTRCYQIQWVKSAYIRTPIGESV